MIEESDLYALKLNIEAIKLYILGLRGDNTPEELDQVFASLDCFFEDKGLR